jgi:hypothetical protein
MEVPPTEPTAVKIWRRASANVYERMMYECINCIKINKCKKSGKRPPNLEKSEIRIQDEHPGSYFRELRHHNFGLKYLNSLMWIRNGKILYLGSGNSLMRIRDGKILDP